MATNLSPRTAAVLEALSYSNPHYALPDGWRLYKTGENNGSSLSVFQNDSTKQIVFAFRGSETRQNWISDILNAGAASWGDIKSTAKQYFSEVKDRFADYQVVADGHSLGGGMAQIFALENNLSCTVQNSLPMSPFAIQGEITDQGKTLAEMEATWVASGNTCDQLVVDKEVATMAFGQLPYLPGSVTVLKSDAGKIELFGLALAVGAPALAPLGLAIAAYGAAMEHPIDVVIQKLDESVTQDDPPGQDPQPVIEAGALLAAESQVNLSFEPTGNPTVSLLDGSTVVLSSVSMTPDLDTFEFNISGQSPQRCGIVTAGSGLSLDASALGLSYLDDMSGGNVVQTYEGLVLLSNGDAVVDYGSALLAEFGSGNTLDVGDGGAVRVVGADNSVVGGNWTSIDVAGGGGNRISVGQGSRVSVGGNGASGADDLVSTTSSSLVLDSDSRVVVVGDDNDIEVAAGRVVAVRGLQDSVVAAGGDDIELDGCGGDTVQAVGVNTIRVIGGVNVSISTGNGSSVEVGGNGLDGFVDRIFTSGSSVVEDSSAHVEISGDDDVVRVAMGSAVNVIGSDDLVSAAGGDRVTLVGGSSSTVEAVGRNWIQLDHSLGASVSTGAGSDLDVWGVGMDGAGDWIRASGSSLTLHEGTNIQLVGDGDDVSIESRSLLTVDGSDNAVTGATGDRIRFEGGGSGDSLEAWGSNVIDLENAGGGDWITTGQGSDVHVGGIVATGIRDSISTSGSKVTADASMRAFVIGAFDVIDLAVGSALEVDGPMMTIDAAGHDEIDIDSGVETVVQACGSNVIRVHDFGQDSITTGTGSTVEFSQVEANCGSDWIYASGSAVIVDAGSAGSILGDDDDLFVQAGSYAWMAGDDNHVVLDIGDMVGLQGDRATITANGGDMISLEGGRGDNVVAFGAGNVVRVVDTSLTLTGDDVQIDVLGGSSLDVTGSGLSVTMNFGDEIHLDGAGSGDTIRAWGPDVIDVDNVGGNLIFAGYGSSLVIAGTGNTVDAGIRSTLVIGGSGHTISADDSTIVEEADSSFELYGFYDNVDMGAGSRLQASGSGLTIDASGRDEINLGDGYMDTVVAHGSGNQVDLSSGALMATIDLEGSGDTLDIESSYCRISVASGQVGEVITGSCESIALGGDDVVSLSGSNNTVEIRQSGDTVLGSNLRINVLQRGIDLAVGGANDIIVASGDVVALAGSDQDVTINGTDNVFDVSGTNDRVVENLSGGGSIVETWVDGTETIETWSGYGGTGNQQSVVTGSYQQGSGDSDGSDGGLGDGGTGDPGDPGDGQGDTGDTGETGDTGDTGNEFGQGDRMRATSLHRVGIGRVGGSSRNSLIDARDDLMRPGRPISDFTASERSAILATQLIIQAMASCGTERAAIERNGHHDGDWRREEMLLVASHAHGDWR